MERKITFYRLIALFIVTLAIAPGSFAQVYQHTFGTTAISAYPYTVAPATLHPDLSGSSWINSTGEWTSFAGSGGNPDQAIALDNSSGLPTITLTFNVAVGKTLDITSFNFYRRRSNSGAQNWSMSINGINVGAGTVTTAGAATGNTPVANPVNGLTGPVTVVISLSGASGTGTFRLDDFTLNGTVNSGCTAPGITSFTPASGPSNTMVTITGSGFEAGTGTTSVKFGTVEAAGFTVVSDTEIKALVPSTADTGTVSVTSNGCAGVSTVFTVLTSACATVTPPADLFISEIYDAELGEGGAIELFNGTTAPIDLSQYSLARFNAITGGTASWDIPLNGILAPGGVYIARTAQAVCGLSGTPSTTLTTGFNELDRLELRKNTVVIDVVQTPSATGFSIIRNGNAIVPAATYNGSDWTLLNTEDCAGIGLHSVSSGSTNNISAQPLSAAVCEGDNTQYTVTLSNPGSFTYQWKMLNASGNWVNITDGENFGGTTTAQLTIIDAPLNFNAAQFYCQATATGCVLVSNAVQLTVSPLPLAIVVPVQPTCTIPTGGLLIVPSVGDGLTFSLDGVNFQAGLSYTGIAPGTYTLTLKSSSNCITTLPVTIAPAPLTPAVADITVTQPDCTTTTGTITVNGPLDASFAYSLDGTLFQTGTTFAGLAPGTYTVTVRNILGGCTSVTANITINAVPAAPAVATATAVQPTCDNPTGTITVTAPLGAEYTYSADGTNFQANPVFAGLAPGTYTITTQNTAGCSSVTATGITINAAPLTPAVATTSVIQPTCTTTTGTITVTAPIGAGFSYSIDGTNFQSGTQFTNLVPGNYTITTQSSDGCTSVTATQVTIDPVPAGPAVANFSVTQPTCATSTGTITVTDINNANFTYSIDGVNFQPTPQFSGLAPGNYVLTTQNSAGCTASTATITINPAPAGPAVAATTVTQPTCTTPTGTIEVTGTVGLSYSIDGTNFQTTTTFAGLAPGNYTITSRDANGCTSATTTIAINPPVGAPAVATTIVTQPTCALTTGSIEVTSPTGLSYSIDGTNFQSTTTFAGLAPGSYTITAQDANGCTSVTAAITINAIPAAPAVATTTITQPTCTTPTGTIEVTGPVGAQYSYSIDGTNFQNGTSFTNLAPGSYTLTTRNTDGCTSTASVTIDAVPGAPAVATFTVTQPNCSGVTTGTIVVETPTGAGLTYSIDGTNFQATTTFAGLAPGNYTITTQNAGCSSVTGTITINPVPTTPAVATYTPTQPTCAVPSGTIEVTGPLGAGYEYSIDGTNFQSGTTFANLAGDAYIITVRNAGGCTSTTPLVVIDPNPTPAVATTDVTQPTCFTAVGRIDVTAPTGSGFSYSIDGTNFQNGTGFINLAAGNYTITVRNIQGCTSTASVTINNQPATPAAPVVSSVQPNCATGTGTISVTSPLGTEYQYSIDGSNYQDSADFSGLQPGTYMISVMTDSGCKSADTSITLTEPAANIAVSVSQGCEGTFGSNYMVQVSATGDVDDTTATFNWTNEAGQSVSTGADFNVTQYIRDNAIEASAFPLTFMVMVTTPGGCVGMQAVTIDGAFCDIPKGISPNNDGMNDSFDVSGMGVKKLSIYNRYGQEIYTRNNYTNEWIGQTNNDDEAPTGTYYYVIEQGGRSLTGWVYVNREQ